MSLWLKRKGSTSSVTIPVEALIIPIGLFVAIIAPRYIGNIDRLSVDSLFSAFAGFIFFFIAKVSLFRKGIWNSWGSNQMEKKFKECYWTGCFLMLLGVTGVWFWALKANAL
jgi:hypothetical protein